MGWTRKHVDADGVVSYTSRYRDALGRTQTAGTFRLKNDAITAYKAAETKIAEGRIGDPRRGRQKFAVYVNGQWLPHHVIEVSTRQGYTYQIGKHLIAYFGEMRMIDITSEVVREWVSECTAIGMAPKTLYNVKNILSAIFTTALNDQVVFYHPCRGVKTPRAPRKELKIITPEQFDLIYEALPEAYRLMAETDIETGLRWGELAELRVRDLEPRTRTLTVSRVVVEVNDKFHPDGAGHNFLVKEYPKDGETRRVKISADLTRRIVEHIEDHQLGPDDLLFPFQDLTEPERTAPDPQELGLTEPNAAGRRYRHGTTSGYNAGKCKCRPCRDAIAAYRAAKRAASGATPRRRRRRTDEDGHISRDWYRQQVWNKALEVAAIGIHVRTHDLRHAHASWLLAGGADLQQVKERLGHGSITTSEKYLHTLPDADESALDAFTSIRHRSRRR